MKRSTGWRGAGLAAWLLVAMATVGLAQQPTVVVSLRGVDALLGDAAFVEGELGSDGLKDSVELAISNFTGGKGLAGIDRGRPLGVYWSASETNPLQMPVAFIPVSKVEDLKELLTELTPDFKDEDGEWSLTFNGTRLFGKVSEKYLFVSTAPDVLEELADPARIVNAKYDVALNVSIASIPDTFKEQFLMQAEQAGRQSMADGPEPDSEIERVGRDLGFEGTLAVLKSLIMDGDALTWGIDFDQKTRLGSVELGITGKPKTDLAGALTAYGKLQPAFAGIGSETAPLRMLVSFPTKGFADKSEALFATMRQSVDQQLDDDPRLTSDQERDDARKFAGGMFDIIEATLKSGEIHSGLVLETADSGKARFLSGVRLERMKDANRLFDEAIKASQKNPEVKKLTMDVAKHAGARIHAIAPDSSEATDRLLGSDPIHLAFVTDSLWVGGGEGNLAFLKKALDRSPKAGARGTRGVSPVSIHVRPADLVLLMEQDDDALIERAKKLAGEPGDTFKLDLLPVPNGATLRIAVGIDVVKLVKHGE